MQVTGNRVVQNLSGADNMRHVEPGDFISHLRSFQGGLEYSALRGKVSAAYTVLAPRKPLAHGYFRYLFKSTLYIQALQTTTDQLRDGQSIRYQQFALLPLPLPPVQEQQQIAEYLDRETEQIDELITKQEQLVATLTERRQAVITQAVTRGLDPEVKLKDSQVDWLGMVPSSWRLGQLRRFATCSSGGAVAGVSEKTEDNFVAVLGGNGLMGYTSAANADLGSLAVGRVGALCGNVHLVSEPSWISDNALHLKPGPMFESAYLAEALRARDLNTIASKSAQPLIVGSQVMSQVVPVPPLPDQLLIVVHIQQIASSIDMLLGKVTGAIALLRERRQALISAAVTGKIEVRGL